MSTDQQERERLAEMLENRYRTNSNEVWFPSDTWDLILAALRSTPAEPVEGKALMAFHYVCECCGMEDVQLTRDREPVNLFCGECDRITPWTVTDLCACTSPPPQQEPGWYAWETARVDAHKAFAPPDGKMTIKDGLALDRALAVLRPLIRAPEVQSDGE